MIALFRLKKLSWDLYKSTPDSGVGLIALADNVNAIYNLKYRWWRCFNKDFRKHVEERLNWYKDGRC